MSAETMLRFGGILAGSGAILLFSGLWFVWQSQCKPFDCVITALCGFACLVGVFAILISIFNK